MKRERSEEPGFSIILLGSVIGFFLGLGIIYWFINRQNDSQLAINENTRVESVFSVSHPPLNDKHKLITDTVPEEPLIESKQVISEQKSVKNRQQEKQKTLSEESQIEVITQDDEDNSDIENVKQDKLLKTRSFSIYYTEEDTEKHHYHLLDSLIGNHQSGRHIQTMVNVEFWISPTRFQGYRKIKNRIVVFGLEYPELANLSVVEDGILLKYNNDVYLMVENESFQPFEPFIEHMIPGQF